MTCAPSVMPTFALPRSISVSPLRRASQGLLALLLLLLTSTAHAQAVSDADRAEAKERFARGVERLRAEDFHSAATHFEKAYEVAPFAVILYNLGVSYAKLDRPTEAAAALQKVLDEPGKLRPERIARAKELLAEQKAKIGNVQINVAQSGADVRIDGKSMGKTPLATAKQLRAGRHFVEVLKTGFAPHRQEIEVAGNKELKLDISLEATELAFAQVWIRTQLPQVEIWLDERRIGLTPLEQSFPVLPGKHAIELRREGYHSLIKRIDVGPGATVEVKATPTVDKEAVRDRGGMLSLAAEDLDDLVLTVDGERHGQYAGAIALAPGLHAVKVERAGFFPTTLSVFIARGGELQRQVVMDPTPETVADHNAESTLYTALGWTFTSVAALSLGGGVAFTVWNENSPNEAEDNFFPFLEPGQLCDQGTPAVYDDAECTARAQLVDDERAARADRRPVSYALFIGGGALLATGITLLVLAPDADKYKPNTDELEDLSRAPMIVPVLAPTVGGGYAGVRGTF